MNRFVLHTLWLIFLGIFVCAYWNDYRSIMSLSLGGMLLCTGFDIGCWLSERKKGGDQWKK